MGSDQSGKDKIRKSFRILLLSQAGEMGTAKLGILPPSAVAGASSLAMVAGKATSHSRTVARREKHGEDWKNATTLFRHAPCFKNTKNIVYCAVLCGTS